MNYQKIVLVGNATSDAQRKTSRTTWALSSAV
jgi:hypothetical protein